MSVGQTSAHSTEISSAGLVGRTSGVRGTESMPRPPSSLEDAGVDPNVLADLALKLAFSVPRIKTETAAEKLCLPLQVTGKLLDGLRRDNLLETIGKSGPFGFVYAITNLGRERARRLLEISGYVGPAPVSLNDYSAQMEAQMACTRQPTLDGVNRAIADIVLSDDARNVAGLAIMSGRSLFVYGPPGNGKTSLSFLLHNAAEGELWIPHCIAVEQEIIRVFDPQAHVLVNPNTSTDQIKHDRRWLRVKRPFIVVGGELTIEALDLIYDPQLGFYQSPLHFKANGGTFMIDDFGCQRVQPEELLNRWIHPLEQGTDYLTLKTGQQLEVPFQQMIIVSTNLDPSKVMSPAFLRRMGYRLYLGNPTPETYTEIFQRYAQKHGLEVPATSLDRLLKRYQVEGRPLRGCEPRDLIERVRDVCKYLSRPLELSDDHLDLAWRGYFGQDPPDEE